MAPGNLSGMESSSTFTCARCDSTTESYDGSLGLALFGAGDRGVIDTFPEGSINVTLCESCALHMLKQEQWLLKACAPSLNINYGHECLDGAIHWAPMADCEIDPDRHGWLRVFAVIPLVEGRVGTRAPLRTPSDALASYGSFSTPEEAEAHAASLTSDGFPSRVSQMPSGNYRNFYEEMHPADFAQWWPTYNTKWMREHNLNELRETAIAVVRQPRWSLTHPLHVVRALSSATLAVISR